MTFSFGVFDSFDLGVLSPGEVLHHRLDFAVRAEAAGIEHYHVTEHHGTPLSVCPSPNIFLAALAQRTTTMRLGPLVYVLPAYDPLRLVEEIATLDHLSGGRLDVGVGSGVSPYELASLGVEPDAARQLYDETLEILRAGLTDGAIHHRGRRIRDIDATLSIRPVQRPHPPLWYASSNTRTAEWAGARSVHFVGRWNGGTLAPAVESYRAAAVGAGAAASLRVGSQATVLIGDTDAGARERFRAAHDVFFGQLSHLWHEHDDRRVDAMGDVDAALDRGNALVGSVSTVRDALLAQVDAAPTTYFEALLWFGDLTPDEAHENLRRFTGEVVPAVRERAATRIRAATDHPVT